MVKNYKKADIKVLLVLHTWRVFFAPSILSKIADVQVVVIKSVRLSKSIRLYLIFHFIYLWFLLSIYLSIHVSVNQPIYCYLMINIKKPDLSRVSLRNQASHWIGMCHQELDLQITQTKQYLVVFMSQNFLS